MTLEELKFFTEQFSQIRQEFKQEVKDLRDHIDAMIGGHADKLDDHEKRLSDVERYHWRLTVICGGIVIVAQLIINIVIELTKA